jgi:hypothetical protein
LRRETSEASNEKQNRLCFSLLVTRNSQLETAIPPQAAPLQNTDFAENIPGALLTKLRLMPEIELLRNIRHRRFETRLAFFQEGGKAVATVPEFIGPVDHF